jgi:hypothetical protein
MNVNMLHPTKHFPPKSVTARHGAFTDESSGKALLGGIGRTTADRERQNRAEHTADFIQRIFLAELADLREGITDCGTGERIFNQFIPSTCCNCS